MTKTDTETMMWNPSGRKGRRDRSKVSEEEKRAEKGREWRRGWRRRGDGEIERGRGRGGGRGWGGGGEGGGWRRRGGEEQWNRKEYDLTSE